MLYQIQKFYSSVIGQRNVTDNVKTMLSIGNNSKSCSIITLLLLDLVTLGRKFPHITFFTFFTFFTSLHYFLWKLRDAVLK